jgi:hypothetical protein
MLIGETNTHQVTRLAGLHTSGWPGTSRSGRIGRSFLQVIDERKDFNPTNKTACNGESDDNE